MLYHIKSILASIFLPKLCFMLTSGHLFLNCHLHAGGVSEIVEYSVTQNTRLTER